MTGIGSHLGIVLFQTLVCVGGGNIQGVTDIALSVPREMNGWEARSEDSVYDRKTIFDYINGGGEVYLTYSFVSVLTREYSQPGQPSIFADVFDMGSSQDAFGIFSLEREGEDAGIGQDSEYTAGLLRFWKDRFFVSLTAEYETPSATGTVSDLGHSIAEAIVGTGTPPRILTLLPPSGLHPREVCYFHKQFGLNSRYFLSDKNILLLDEHTDGLLAPYGSGPERNYLLFVDYHTSGAAKAALEAFLLNYMPDADPERFAKLEDGRWAAARTEKGMLLIVLDSPTREAANGLLEEAARLARRHES